MRARPSTGQRVASLAVLLTAGWVGCTSEPGTAVDSVANPYAELELSTRTLYPNVETLYTGEHGLYRGCGPNNGVCHNSREFPNLATMGSLVQNIGLPCNEKRDDPTQLHDLCERSGDSLRAGTGAGVEIAFIDPDPEKAPLRGWKIHLREPITAGGAWRIIRSTQTNGKTNEIELANLRDVGATVTLDPNDPTHKTVSVTASPVKPGQGESEEDEGEDDIVGPLFEHAGTPGNPLVIQVGDPNRNGTFGAALGGRIIAPGDPAKSYIFTRLTDPSAGPVMPRANCCFWTKASLRALWCWVAGLAPDGENALAPIGYENCPPGPPDTMAYPTPGPACETSGMCPLQPIAAPSDAVTFANVYATILKPSCTGCHVGSGAPGRLDMSTKEKAYGNLVESRPVRVVPGDPRASTLFQRVTPELCRSGCALMPKNAPPLDDRSRGLLEQWIAGGAKND